MALNFNELPQERPVPDDPPSMLLWTIVFFVLVLAGVFGVILLWPANEPTQTPWFWTCITIFPVGIAFVVVSRRYSAYEDARLDAQAWNRASRDHTDAAFAKESIPMLILASSIRVSEVEDQNGVDQIADKVLSVKARASEHEHNASVSAHWLQPDDCLLAVDDAERHSQLLEWIFEKLLDDLKDTLLALPDGFPLRVLLNVSDYVGEAGIESLWRASWTSHGLREADVQCVPEPIDLMAVDRWLDDGDGPLQRYAVLLVSASLNGLIDVPPVDGRGEIGVGLLLASTALAHEFKVAWTAAVHRPLESDGERLEHALKYAMRWAEIEPEALEAGWASGIDGETAGPLNAALTHTKVRSEEKPTLQTFDLDRAVGDTGICAGWLGIACAAHRAVRVSAPQLVVRMCSDSTILAVVRSNDSNNSNISTLA